MGSAPTASSVPTHGRRWGPGTPVGTPTVAINPTVPTTLPTLQAGMAADTTTAGRTTTVADTTPAAITAARTPPPATRVATTAGAGTARGTRLATTAAAATLVRNPEAAPVMRAATPAVGSERRPPRRENWR